MKHIISLNENIVNITISELKTVINVLYYNSVTDSNCTKEELSEYLNIDPKTIYKHMKKAEEAGIIIKKNKKYAINDRFFQLPTEYTPINPTFSIVIEEAIDENYAYSLQIKFGKKHSKYMNDKHILIEDIIFTDEIESKVGYTINIDTLNYKIFNK